MTKLINLEGQKFGKLIVIKYVGNSKWLCKCECGNKKIVNGKHLRGQEIFSCGCYRSKRAKQMVSEFHEKNKKHKMSKTRIYHIWQGIKDRCTNTRNPAYKNYGERGIIICEEWKNDFIKFYMWAKNNGYKDNLTIDRINNNGNYEPYNCRWIPLEMQAQNTRNNINITYNNETHCLAEWGRILKIDRHKVKEVLLNGAN